MKIFGVDPGPEDSAFLVLEDGRVSHFGIVPNAGILQRIDYRGDTRDSVLVIEMVASYGMPVGREVFETCVWIGRFEQAWGPAKRDRLTRQDVKRQLCNGNMRAKDKHVRQVMLDRFGPGKAKAVGLKKTPGPLYGISKDVWAALAIAVAYSDLHELHQEGTPHA